MHPSVEAAADEIRTMEVRGAAAIGRHAAEALAEAARAHDGPADDFERDLRAAGEHLGNARPTAVSLQNAITYVLGGLDADDPATEVPRRGDDFVQRSLRARDAASTIAAEGLRGPVALTICNSQAAVEAIAKAHEAGTVEEAVAFETRPWRQGLITARQLRDRGVPVTLMVDSTVSLMADQADSCVVGADTLVQNGDVINKIGTRLLALSARDADIPFLVCAESFKAHPTAETGADIPIEQRPVDEVVDPDEVPGIRVRNPVFEVTPPRLVHRICTELGADEPIEAVRRALEAWA